MVRRPGTVLLAIVGLLCVLATALLGSPIQAGVVAALTLSAVVMQTTNPGAIGAVLRRRWLLGVPWGTLLTVAVVVGWYLLGQGGLDHWYAPTEVPFTAWSYLYPLGWLTAAFSHSGPGHLTGNVFGTLAFAPIVEYTIGHFPRRRGATSFGRLRDNPIARSMAFPLGVIAVGVLATLISWMPLVGFSGVVFAFAGFALVTRPITALLALLAQRGARTAFEAVRSPVVPESAGRSFSQPWWAETAVQGHLVGLFIGVALGAGWCWWRSERPDPRRLFVGIVLFGFAQAIWALWWYRGPSSYVLHQGAGVALVLLVGLLVALVVPVRDQHLFDEFTTRHLAVFLVILPLVVMAGIAIPTNAVEIGDTAATGGENASEARDYVEVRDYTVDYEENVPNARLGLLDVEAFGESTAVNSSGVIVTSDRRQLWSTQVSKTKLQSVGRTRVILGGLGWRESVVVDRRGWIAVGNASVYHVWLKAGGRDAVRSFTAPPSTAEPTIAGRNVTVAGTDDGTFTLTVRRENRTLGTTAVPGENETTTTAGLRFRRQDDRILATHDGTRVPVFRSER
jgi:membrane associated rhomboid family serine protease